MGVDASRGCKSRGCDRACDGTDLAQPASFTRSTAYWKSASRSSVQAGRSGRKQPGGRGSHRQW